VHREFFPSGFTPRPTLRLASCLSCTTCGTTAEEAVVSDLYEIQVSY